MFRKLIRLKARHPRSFRYATLVQKLPASSPSEYSHSPEGNFPDRCISPAAYSMLISSVPPSISAQTAAPAKVLLINKNNAAPVTHSVLFSVLNRHLCDHSLSRSMLVPTLELCTPFRIGSSALPALSRLVYCCERGVFVCV